MPVGSCESLLTLSTQCKMIPLIESRTQLVRVLNTHSIKAILLRHCNLFELAGTLEHVQKRNIAVYVSIDHIDGIHADNAGLQFLANTLHVQGIISSHPRTLALAKTLGLETIQRIFALDSTGMEAALESVDIDTVDLLDISPALVIPHIAPKLQGLRPFIASGLIQTTQQMHSVLRAGAISVVVARDELWPQ
jgi:glycerol uptake operon antiterminator